MSSLINPNATCPVCGQSVFFYSNEYGSRVFFNSLWPDWDKHSCTDNPRLPVGRIARPALAAPKILAPISTDWIPISFQRRDVEDGWYVLRFHGIQGDLIRILTIDDISPRRDSPAYMKPWDEHSLTELEFINSEVEVQRVLGWKYAVWFLETPESCFEAREKPRSQDGSR